MWITIVGFGTFLIMFSLLMFVVHITRPKIFKLRAAVTKWISFDVEMQQPHDSDGEGQ